MNLDTLTDTLEQAVLNNSDIVRLTSEYPDLTIDDGYAIQRELRRRALARDDDLTGVKLGLTSHAKQQQMGVEEPVYGFLLGSTRIDNNGHTDSSSLIHPKVEPELAVRLKEPLGATLIEAIDVLSAIDGLASAIEVIDSRYQNFDFTLRDVIADNTSAARWVTGDWTEPTTSDLASMTFTFTVDGQSTPGTAAATMGDPLVAVAAIANFYHRHGDVIAAGTVILTGGLSAAVTVSAGSTARCHFDGLEPVVISFV